MVLIERLRDRLGGNRSGGRRLRYRCRGCDVRYKRRHHSCPQCGGFRLERDGERAE